MHQRDKWPELLPQAENHWKTESSSTWVDGEEVSRSILSPWKREWPQRMIEVEEESA